MHIANSAGLQICPLLCGHQYFERGMELVAHCLVFHGVGVPGMPPMAFVLKILADKDLGPDLCRALYIQTCAAQALNTPVVLDVSDMIGGIEGRGRGVYDDGLPRFWDNIVDEEDRQDTYGVVALMKHRIPGTTFKYVQGRSLLISIDNPQARAVISVNTSLFRGDMLFKQAICHMLGGFICCRDGHPIWSKVLPLLAAIIASPGQLNFHVMKVGAALSEFLRIDQDNVIKVLLKETMKAARTLSFILIGGYWVQDLSFERLYMKHRDDTNFNDYCTIIAMFTIRLGSTWGPRIANKWYGTLQFCQNVNQLTLLEHDGLMVRALFVQLITGLLDNLPREFCMSQYCTEVRPYEARADKDMRALFRHPGMEATYLRLTFFQRAMAEWPRVASLTFTFAAFSDFLDQVVLPPDDSVTEQTIRRGTAPPMNLKARVAAPTLWQYNLARVHFFKHESLRGLVYEQSEEGGERMTV